MGKFDKYSADVRLAISHACEEAQRVRHRLIGPEHLLMGVLKLHNPLIEGLFASLHVSTASISQALDFVMGRGNKALVSEPTLNGGSRAILARAEEKAASEEGQLVGIEHVFVALFEEQNGIAVGVLESFGVNLDVASAQLSLLMRNGYEHLVLTTQFHSRYQTTPTLNLVSRDLTIAALEDTIDPLIGREAELERMMQILSRRSKNNPVLIGPAGVGKTAIAEGLALSIIQGKVPDNLLHCRIVALDVGLLSIGTRFRGDFEERMKRILREMITTSGLIVFIDELHTLIQVGVADGSIDASNLFKPMLARGEFQCIGATTLDEYRKTIEMDPALERRFQAVLVSEATEQDTLKVLHGLRSRYEAFHRVKICDEALQAAVKMSSRYIHKRFFPDKALDLIDEAASYVRVQCSVVPDSIRRYRDEIAAVQQEKDEAIAHCNFPGAAYLLKCERQLRQSLWQAEHGWLLRQEQHYPTVGVEDVAKIVSLWTGIPVVQVTEEESLRLMNLEQELYQRVIGQDEAVQALAKAVRRSRAQIRNTRRPIGSFIFVGPTGVGKTELARALTVALFGDEGAMLKLDMSEFMESHTVSRLIGSPPGYVGYDQAGQLTEAVRRRPYSVVLFDEAEKAHPRIFDLLLQILEDGCLTDARGQAIDFRHTIIILTSNAGTVHKGQGSMIFAPSSGEPDVTSHEQIRERAIHGLREVFRAELLDRIDEVLVFHALDRTHLRQIIDLIVEQTQQRLAAQSIDLQVTDEARLLLATRGYDAQYGARPLRRTVQHLLEDRLAEAILRGSCGKGDSVIVDVVDDQLCTNVQMCAVSTKSNGQGHVAA
ncbi:MAG TPA: ATP-dependent Clp protease ATP-binding subunit [Ktedonobacteraceae bacterium]|nr:ATP-dependent Clp protease ATP-binding subunit [Ktedonobacteraceae bacterium]